MLTEEEIKGLEPGVLVTFIGKLWRVHSIFSEAIVTVSAGGGRRRAKTISLSHPKLTLPTPADLLAYRLLGAPP
jgi:hypothetical protein